ncbi:CBS domain-containing protein [Virgibacillus sediminis]|uniref:CBS domain-containing protein n=1 Tax=Virgibacillus sediminis TaxID=202260 RepID=A0ABV7A542_9BACI
MTVLQEVMTERVVDAKPTDNLLTLAKEMETKDVGMIPVMGNGNVEGILTDRDIVTKGLAKNKDVEQVTAGEVMNENVVTGLPDMDISEAAKVMQDHQISRLLVAEDNEVKGVVSLGDISLRDNDELSGGTLEEVKKPRH